MTRTVSLPTFESPDSDPNPTFNVVIAYEDFETGKQAKKTYDFLVQNLGHECRFTNQMWKFEVLSIPKLREMAARDAGQADIVLVSCHGDELPPEVKAWIELWVAEPNHPLALVALFGDKKSPRIQETRSYLESVAKRGQMEFFAQPDEWSGNHRDGAFADILPNAMIGEGRVTNLSAIMQRDLSMPHWGINE